MADELSAPVRFQISWEKAIEALVWLANEKPGISIYYVAKVLFYADKEHLIEYGRPIIGDTYIAMQHGPVPSGVKNLVDRDSWLDPDLLERVSDATVVERGSHPSITAKRPPNLDVLSETDLACLRNSLRTYGDMPFGRLRELTHEERAWIAAPDNGSMDYALMVDDDCPDRDELIEEIRESAAYGVL